MKIVKCRYVDKQLGGLLNKDYAREEVEVLCVGSQNEAIEHIGKGDTAVLLYMPTCTVDVDGDVVHKVGTHLLVGHGGEQETSDIWGRRTL